MLGARQAEPGVVIERPVPPNRGGKHLEIEVGRGGNHASPAATRGLRSWLRAARRCGEGGGQRSVIRADLAPGKKSTEREVAANLWALAEENTADSEVDGLDVGSCRVLLFLFFLN